ncbi:MAG: monofunctional biosynthetic peptidoglycan transglycosylase [Myxococcota bacterium]
MIRKVARWILASAAVVAAIPLFTVAQVLWVRFVDPPGTPTMVQRMVTATAIERRPRRWYRVVVPLAALGPTVPRAVLSAEDARFYLHDGFDWDAICDAVDHNQRSRRVRGASTISQQTAKNLFLWQGRSWVRKGLEVWYTVLLESLVPKDRILELYLNVAETGPLVFGVEAGARHHFGRSAAALSGDQAGRLAGIFPDPLDRSVDGSAARERAAWVRANPAPMPGDPGFDRLRADWDREWRGPWRCVGF